MGELSQVYVCGKEVEHLARPLTVLDMTQSEQILGRK